MGKNIIRSLTYFLFCMVSILDMANGLPDPVLVKKYAEKMDDKKSLDLRNQ